MTNAGPARRGRLDLLLIVRGLAALSVVVWHTEGYKGYFPPVLNTSGRLAVWLFFGISGYVIAYGFIHGRYRLALSDLRYFYWNRFLRIYPLFLLLSLLAWMTEWTRTGLNPIGLKDVPAQFLAVQWNQDYTLIGVFWTLGIELHFYLVAPLLAMVLLLRTRWWPAIALIVYAGLTCWFEYAATNLGWSWDGRNIVSNLPHFFAGMLACAWGSSLTRDRRWMGWLCVAGALGLLGYTNWLYNIHPDRFWSVRSILLTDALIVLLVVAHAHFATRERPLPVVARSLGFLGTVSYGVYAWHGYVMNYVPWTADHVVVLSTVSVGLAYASYRLLERPALARKKHPELRDDSSNGEVAVQAV